MAIHDIFSKRQKKLKGDVPDVYVYDSFPMTLRVQFVQIWTEVLGSPSECDYRPQVQNLYKSIVMSLRREYGVFHLPNISNIGNYFCNELIDFFMKETDVDRIIDVAEYIFNAIDRVSRSESYRYDHAASETADNAIAELNYRMKEHGVGYQYSNGEIIRIDSELIHAETVIPALRLLRQKHYAGAEQEFLKAYEHFRKGNAKEALNEALKSFESVMKAICVKQGWEHSNTPQAKELIEVCLEHKLIPDFWQSHYMSLRSLLESSVPTGRNKLGGHGQGVELVEVPDYLVSYMLHMTASAIVFLAKAEEALKG